MINERLYFCVLVRARSVRILVRRRFGSGATRALAARLSPAHLGSQLLWIADEEQSLDLRLQRAGIATIKPVEIDAVLLNDDSSDFDAERPSTGFVIVPSLWCEFDAARHLRCVPVEAFPEQQ